MKQTRHALPCWANHNELRQLCVQHRDVFDVRDSTVGALVSPETNVEVDTRLYPFKSPFKSQHVLSLVPFSTGGA